VRRRFKRLIDVMLALSGLVVLAPVIAGLALAVRAALGSPVIFRQQRSGIHGRSFWMLKFRSMTDERDPQGRLLPDDQRLTGLGRMLRKTSLDELPQLWNVLKGEMSLIGPRPLPVEYWDLYTREQRRRHSVPPGVVGWAGVNGRNANTWEKKFELDLYYVDHWSLVLDAQIFVMAISTALSGSGVSQVGEATCGVFTGTVGSLPVNQSSARDEKDENSASPHNPIAECDPDGRAVRQKTSESPNA
jgi:sugar transferase EpsL